MNYQFTKDKFERISTKIRKIDELPTYDEVVAFMQFLEDKSIPDEQKPAKAWNKFCNEAFMWQIPNQEFVKELASTILEFHDPITLETHAGIGKLSYWLRKHGVNVQPVDDFSYRLPQRMDSLVEKLDYKQALRKYSPSLVLNVWMPGNADEIKDIIKTSFSYPSVNYLIEIGHPTRLYIPEDVKSLPRVSVDRYTTSILDMITKDGGHRKPTKAVLLIK